LVVNPLAQHLNSFCRDVIKPVNLNVLYMRVYPEVSGLI